MPCVWSRDSLGANPNLQVYLSILYMFTGIFSSSSASSPPPGSWSCGSSQILQKMLASSRAFGRCNHLLYCDYHLCFQSLLSGMSTHMTDPKKKKTVMMRKALTRMKMKIRVSNKKHRKFLDLCTFEQCRFQFINLIKRIWATNSLSIESNLWGRYISSLFAAIPL